MKPKTKKQTGFSLIEILIVIGIIGVLAVIATVSYQRSQLQSRDAKRISDIKELFSSLSLYYTNTESFPPDCATSGYVGGCDAANNSIITVPIDTSSDGQFMEFLKPQFLGVTPRDPLNTPEYSYYYATDVEYPAGSGDFYMFLIGARLESANNKPNTALPVPTGFEDFYVIGEKL